MRISQYFVILASLLTLISASGCAGDPPPPPTPNGTGQVVIVAAAMTKVMADPSAQARVLVTALRNTEFEVSASTEGWFKVSTRAGGDGWIPEADVGVKVNRAGRVCAELSLERALSLGAIDGRFEGTGASSGASVTLKAKGALSVEVCPSFRRGTLMKNANAGAQNMTLVDPAPSSSGVSVDLTFEPDIEAEYVFEAYCLEFEKDNPSENDSFELSGTAPPDVLKVLNVNSEDIKAIQLAIWAITDDVAEEDVIEKFEATDEDIANARQIIISAGLNPSTYRLFVQ